MDSQKNITFGVLFVSQILSEDILKNTCEDSQLCVIAVLPHILDTGETRLTSDSEDINFRNVTLKNAKLKKCKSDVGLWGTSTTITHSPSTVLVCQQAQQVETATWR